jgi:hypothetical protein
MKFLNINRRAQPNADMNTLAPSPLNLDQCDHLFRHYTMLEIINKRDSMTIKFFSLKHA